ncbi:hypothetical protein BDZ89DRAFT_1044067 [Hymenopellis radicata]|nr:hypothetical protein BDZ89DRAFT_1044067 [Hymenopellis radicata]
MHQSKSTNESEGEPGKEHPPPLEQEPPPKYPPKCHGVRHTNSTAAPYKRNCPIVHYLPASRHHQRIHQDQSSTGATDIASGSEHSEERTFVLTERLRMNLKLPPSTQHNRSRKQSNLLPSVPEPPSMVEDQPTPKKPLFEPPNLPASPRVPKLAMSTMLDDGHYHTVNYIAFFRITSPKSTITTEGGGCELDSWFSADPTRLYSNRVLVWLNIVQNHVLTPPCSMTVVTTNDFDRYQFSPFHRFTPRMVAVAATMLEFRNPIFAIERDGINFTTLSKPRTGKGSPNILRAEMNSVTHGDCIDGIDLNAYTEYPQRFEEYDEDDFVLVAFSFNGYLEPSPLPNQAAAQRVGMSIRFTIRIAHVDDGDSDPTAVPRGQLRDETPLSVIGTHGVADQASGVAVKQELKKDLNFKTPKSRAVTINEVAARIPACDIASSCSNNPNVALKKPPTYRRHIHHSRKNYGFRTVPNAQRQRTSQNSSAENPLLKNAQTPIRRFMPRMIATICELLRFSSPTIPIFKDGILATTAIYPQDDEHFQIKYNEMDGHTHGHPPIEFTAPRPPNSIVPLFDGRAPFALSEYQKLPTLHEELLPDDLVLIAFSLAVKSVRPKPRGYRRPTSSNKRLLPDSVI